VEGANSDEGTDTMVLCILILSLCCSLTFYLFLVKRLESVAKKLCSAKSHAQISWDPSFNALCAVNVLFARRDVPNSPFNVMVEGFAGDAAKVTAAGPGKPILFNR